MTETKSLSGKNVLLIGGGSGMGKASALEIARNGAKVLIAGRNLEALNLTISKSEVPEKISAKETDVTDRLSLDELFDWFDKEIGELDFLIHAAGINVAERSMQELKPKDWDRLIQINLTGSYNVMRLTLERMRLRKRGLIILINSVAGKRSITIRRDWVQCLKVWNDWSWDGFSRRGKRQWNSCNQYLSGEVNTPILNNRKVPPTQEHKESILQPDDVASMILKICQLPERVHIPELVIKPAQQSFV